MIYTSSITTVGVAGVCCNDDGYGYNRVQIDTSTGVVSVNICVYIENADFTTGAAFNIGTIDSLDCRPNGTVTFAGPSFFVPNYNDVNLAAFGGTMEMDKFTVQITEDGSIDVYVDAITTYATLAAVNYVILPINVSFINPTQLVIAILP